MFSPATPSSVRCTIILALFLQYDILAKAMHYAVFCGTLLGIGLFTRFLMREHAFPALSMLIFASIPSVFVISHTAYNDLFVTFFTLAAVYAFMRWSEEKTLIWMILCAIFSGSAAACKYTALLLTPLGCLGILWINSRQKTGSLQALRHIAHLCSCGFYRRQPLLSEELDHNGKSVLSVFYDIFGGLGWDADQARIYDLFIQNLGMGRSLADYLLLPWNLSIRASMDSPQFDGVLGPLFFLTLLPPRQTSLGKTGTADARLCPPDLSILGLLRPADPLSNPPASPFSHHHRRHPDQVP